MVGREPDARFYAERAREAGGRVLVLGAADGRIAGELALRGFEVVAVEPSGLMMELAEQRRASHPAETQARLRMISGDLRAVRLGEKFGAVLAPQSALGTIATEQDLDAALATVAVHLASDGLFALELGGAVPLSTAGARSEGHPHGPGAAGGMPPRLFVPHLRERRERSAARGLRRLRLRRFSVAELDAALQRAGLEARERFGDYDEQPFTAGDALQLVVGGLCGEAPVSAAR